MKLGSIVLDSSNDEELSEFYKNMLGWKKKTYIHEDEEWITLSNKEESTTWLVFQQTSNYQKPVWPEEKDKQQQMIHLDFYSEDVEKSIKHALSCGAKLADYQSTNNWTVLIDPAGHPFCIIPARK